MRKFDKYGLNVATAYFRLPYITKVNLQRNKAKLATTYRSDISITHLLWLYAVTIIFSNQSTIKAK